MFGLTPWKEVITGQFLLSVGALFYTFWWLTAFKPDTTGGGGLKGFFLFILLALSGLGGTVLSAHGAHEMPLPSTWPSSGMIFLLAAIVYFILLAGSVKLFGRQPTTELLLIVCWALLEILVLGVLHEAGALKGMVYDISWAAVAAASVIAFVTYMMYYRMGDRTAYITGAIPLLIDGAVSLLIAFCAK